MPPENARIDITIRLQMDRARRDARQVQTFLSKISKAAQQTGKQGASGVDRLERAIQNLHYSTVSGFDAMDTANRQFDDGLKQTRDDTDKLMQSYVDYSALAQDLAQSAGEIGAMGQGAAMRRDMAESFDYLAERANMSGDEIVKAMQKASAGTVDANTIMATSNMVLGAKFDTSTKDMAKMMSFARLKSKEYGVTVASAFQRMTLGAVKAEVEFLDEYGITIKLNDALEMYAKKLGIAKSQLNANQRSQALWNALLIQADEQLEAFPDGVKKATDAYERWDVKLLTLTETMGDFVDRSKLGPVMSLAAKAIQAVTMTMTPLILMKGMAAKASAAHAAALAAETAAMVAQNKAAGGSLLARIKATAAAKQAASKGGLVSRVAGKIPISKAGLAAAAPAAVPLGLAAASLGLAYKGFRKLKDASKDASESSTKDWDEFADSLQNMADKEKSATEIAERYARNRRGVSEALYKEGNALQNLGMIIVRNNVDEIGAINAKKEEVEQILLLASKAYPEYIAAISAANAELPKGAKALEMLSQAQFNMEKYTYDATEAIVLQKDAVADLAKEIGGPAFRQHVKVVNEAAVAEENKARALENSQEIATTALKNSGLAADDLAARLEMLALAQGDVTQEHLDANEALETLTEGYALGVVSETRWLMGIREAKTGLLELTAAERGATDAARERRDEMDAASLTQADATQALANAAKTYGMDADAARQAQNALAVALEQTTYQQIENRAELDLLAQGVALGTVSQERYEKAVRESLDGVIDLTAAEREAITVANLRSQAVEQEAGHLAELSQITDKYQNQAAQATEQYEASKEQSAIAHAQRKEDIERQHQQRLADIERDYSKSVAEAAIARSGTGILEARERRDEELADAERTRSEGQAGEDRSFAETNRSAVESYNTRLAEIDAARQEELGRVQEMQRQEVEALRQQQVDMVAQIAEAQEAQTAKKIEEIQKQADAGRNASNAAKLVAHAEMLDRMQGEAALTQNIIDNNAVRIRSAEMASARVAAAWRNAYSSPGGGRVGRRGQGGRGGRGRGMAGGGEGMVTGPATFHVARGEREFVHFGGDERMRAPASQMNVGGSVDMNVSAQMGQMVGPLADRLADVLLPKFEDMLVGEIMEAIQQ